MTACYGQEKQPLLQVVIYFSLQNTIYSCNILISKYFLGGVRPCSSLFLHFVNIIYSFPIVVLQSILLYLQEIITFSVYTPH